MKTVFFVLFALSAIAAFADDRDSVYIMGWPRDALTGEPVIDGTRAELMTLDSTVIATVVPTWNERYRPNSTFALKIGVRSGSFIVRVTNPQYQPVVKTFKLKLAKLDGSFSVGNINMRRAIKSQMLGEATVKATKIKFYTKGDTLIYNADAFNLAEGSMLNALVGQLPGAELKRDGRIFVNGKLVESVLLNGKDFFKKDQTVLLDNLPAYTVENIKFYNKESEFGEMIRKNTGKKVDDGSFVMDVVLKRQYQIGWISNVEAGGGTHERWLARLFALRFTPRSRITLYANANNTHENRKPGGNGDWQPSDIGNGVSTTETGGIDYLVDDKRGRWNFEGNANAAHSKTDTETRQSQENFQSSGNTFTRRLQSSENQNTSFNTNHHLRFNMGPEDNRHELEIHLRPNFNYSYSKNANESLEAEFSSNPFELDSWESLFYGPEANKNLTNILVNKVRTQQRSNSTNINGGTTAEASFKMPQTSNYVSINAGFNAKHNKSHSFDLYNLDYATNSDRRHRYFDQPSDHTDANVGLALMTPFDINWDWIAKTRIDYNYTHDKQENSLYRLDWLEEMADADLETLPSTNEALLNALDKNNSYITENDKHQVSLSFNGRYDNNIYRNKEKYARFRFTWKTGMTMHTEKWNYNGLSLQHDRRTAWLPSLGLEVLRNTPGMKHELELQTSYTHQLPSMFSLMGLRFDSDPLNISEGNTNLHRTEVFSAIFFYHSDRWLTKQGQHLSGTIRLYAYRNAVATAQTYNAATGVRSFRPENVNGNWNVQNYATFYSRLGKNGFSMNVSIQDNFYHNVDLTGTDSKTPTRSTVCTNYLSIPVKVDYSRKKVRLGIKAQIAWNHAESKRENFQNINAADINVGLNGNVTLPWNIQLATDFTYFTRCGYAYESMNTDDFVWNAQLSKSIIHGRLTFALVGYDILGQLSNINYTVNSQGSTETWRNVIPRYGMLRISYRLNKQPKKKH